MLSTSQIEDARYYNRKHGVALRPFTDAAVDSVEYVKAVATFQQAHGLKLDGKCGSMTATRFRQELLDGGETKTMTRDDLIEIARQVSEFEGKFWSLNRDGEFRGLFDRPAKGRWHWASANNPKKKHGEHLGLSYGFLQFNQGAGALGELLVVMRDADPALFASVFGEHADELVAVTNRPEGKTKLQGDGLRNQRVQPVGGHDLWTGSYWPNKFKDAGRVEVFQRAQLDYSVSEYMDPALDLATDWGLRTERGLAITFDRCIHYGPRGAREKLFEHNPRKDGQGEHAYLTELVDEWEDRRWGHRVEKLWRDPDLWDGPCDWSHLT